MLQGIIRFIKRPSVIIVAAAIMISIPAFSMCGKKDVAEQRERPPPPREEPFYCEELTGELCQKKCAPFDVKAYRPGYVLRYAVDGAVYLFRSCRRDAVQQSVGDIADACECLVR